MWFCFHPSKNTNKWYWKLVISNTVTVDIIMARCTLDTNPVRAEFPGFHIPHLTPLWSWNQIHIYCIMFSVCISQYYSVGATIPFAARSIATALCALHFYLNPRLTVHTFYPYAAKAIVVPTLEGSTLSKWWSLNNASLNQL